VSPFETPLLSRLQQVGVDNRYPQWLVDSYASAATNAHAEGIAHTAQDQTVPTRAVNHVQLFYKGAAISDQERDAAHVGYADPFVYYEGKNIVEIKRDMELAIVAGSAVSGDTDTASQMAGFINFISTNKTTTTSITLTESVFNDLLELTWGNTAQFPSEVYVGAKLKRTISLYATKNTPFLSADEKKQILTTNQYDSEFGVLTVFLHRDIRSNMSMSDILVIDPNWFATGWLTPLRREVLARDGLRDRYQMSAACTVLFRNEKAALCGRAYSPYIA